jgi:hypothetical protein
LDQAELKKIKEEKTRWVDPATGQKSNYNPLTFVFLVKQRRFDFKKIDLGNPVKTQNPDLGPDRV